MVLRHALQAFLIAGVVAPFSYYAGLAARRLRLPQITGYLVSGMVRVCVLTHGCTHWQPLVHQGATRGGGAEMRGECTQPQPHCSLSDHP